MVFDTEDMVADRLAVGEHTIDGKRAEVKACQLTRPTCMATAQEGAHIQEAILRSKIDSAQQQVVVVLRLTKRNSDVLDTLLKDEYLQKVAQTLQPSFLELFSII